MKDDELALAISMDSPRQPVLLKMAPIWEFPGFQTSGCSLPEGYAQVTTNNQAAGRWKRDGVSAAPFRELESGEFRER